MIHYRFPLLLTIYVIGWGFLPSNSRELLAAEAPVRLSPMERVAQATPTVAAYDRYMKEGYEATDRKDYQGALDSFQKALQERPDDPYARQAVQNVQVYRDQANLLWLLRDQANLLWLLLGLGAAVVGLGVALVFVLGRLRRSAKSEKLEDLGTEESGLPSPDSGIPNFSFLQAKEESNNHQAVPNEGADFREGTGGQEDSTPVPALALQATTRLPNLDVIEALMQDLRESDPKKRRKAIWELAQKSDSRAMKPLVDLMIDTDSQERSLILEALSQISTRTLKPMNQALAISLQDKNPQVRKNAIRDLTRIYDVMSQISQMLCHAIDDTDSEVKETAKWALSQLNLQMPPRLDLTSRPKTPVVTVEQSYTESAER